MIIEIDPLDTFPRNGESVMAYDPVTLEPLIDIMSVDTVSGLCRFYLIEHDDNDPLGGRIVGSREVTNMFPLLKKSIGAGAPLTFEYSLQEWVPK